MATLNPQDIVLAPALEKKIRILLGKGKAITKRQVAILEGIILKAEKGLKATSEMGKISSFGRINIFLLPEHAAKMAEFDSNTAKMFNFGIKFVNKIPDSAVKELEQAMVQSSNGIVSKLGDDIRDKALQTINDGIQQSKLPTEISQDLQQQLQISRARADTIARTETMRASHSASFAQARRDNMSHWTVDSRAEACEECQDTYDGTIYTMDETDDLPPLHPNCACIPVFSDNIEDAQSDADSLSEYNNQQRQDLIDSGVTINKDGTSQHLNT